VKGAGFFMYLINPNKFQKLFFQSGQVMPGLTFIIDSRLKAKGG